MKTTRVRLNLGRTGRTSTSGEIGLQGSLQVLALLICFNFIFSAPADAGGCATLTGVPYQLCSAYCDEMSCDADDPLANKKACKKVMRAFKRVTATKISCEEQAPVCRKDPICPCNYSWMFDQFRDVAIGHQVSTDRRGLGPGVGGLTQLFDQDNALNELSFTTINDSHGGDFACGARLVRDGFSEIILSVSPITEEEHGACSGFASQWEEGTSILE